jgi:hypothetical protein
MHEIQIYAPEVGRDRVIFRWQVDPLTPLYRSSQFELRFPKEVELAKVPAGLWWTIALICLHSQWPLLRPCRIHLPITLRPGERECWLRLIDAEIYTLEAHRETSDIARAIEIIENGPPLEYAALAPSDRCATAFSGGKDSLTQVGLLAELTTRPIVVPTTSPMHLHADHEAPRRRQVFDEIKRRREIEFIEVESDYRECFEQSFAVERGYQASLNEITDTFLYTAALLGAGIARGATHFFLAAEAQAHDNIELDGRVIQSPFYMCSMVTICAISEILAPFGLSLSTMIAPLWRYHVQTLLWTRYADLSDLQYSCYELTADQWACNRCIKCFVLAARALALVGRTSQVGVDWVELINHYRDWQPGRPEDFSPPVLPSNRLNLERDSQIARDLATISWRQMARTIYTDHPRALLTFRGWRALVAYPGLRRRAQAHPSGPPSRYRTELIKFLDPLLRERLATIYNTHFALHNQAADSEDAKSLARIESLLNWILEPLKAKQ